MFVVATLPPCGDFLTFQSRVLGAMGQHGIERLVGWMNRRKFLVVQPGPVLLGWVIQYIYSP